MTQKTAEKPRIDPQNERAPTHEEVHAIYQCHTLAQILYRHLAAAATPWWSRSVLPGTPRLGALSSTGVRRPNPGLTPPWCA